MRTSKLHKVVMLPTEKASPIIINDKGLLDTCINHGFKEYNINNNYKHTNLQHLYFTSVEKPKVGEWCICAGAELDEAYPNNCATVIKYTGEELGVAKIVATTDKELHAIKFRGTPIEAPSKVLKGLKVIPEAFIQAYIKAYNEGKPITTVELEMDEFYCKKDFIEGNTAITYNIKTRDDNTVIVHQAKMYSRDEVIILLNKMINTYPGGHVTQEITDNWIKDNL